MNINTGKPFKKLQHSTNKITVVKVSKFEDKYLATADSTKKIVLWDLKEYKVIHLLSYINEYSY